MNQPPIPASAPRLLDVKHCKDCYNDFYNGRENFGGKNYCYSREKAELVPRLLIPIDLRPPYTHLNVQQVPNCYHRQRYATVKPESLTKEGYWK
jgi:hypothetical protein